MCAEKSRQGCAIEANHIKTILACLSGTLLPGSIPGGSFSIFVLQPAPLFYSLYLSIAFIYFKFPSYLYHSLRISFSSLSFSSFLAVSLSADTDDLCCSVLQYVAVCCSMLQYVAVCCSMLQYVAVCCSVLQYVAVSVSSSLDFCLLYTSHASQINESCLAYVWHINESHLKYATLPHSASYSV